MRDQRYAIHGYETMMKERLEYSDLETAKSCTREAMCGLEAEYTELDLASADASERAHLTYENVAYADMKLAEAAFAIAMQRLKLAQAQTLALAQRWRNDDAIEDAE